MDILKLLGLILVLSYCQITKQDILPKVSELAANISNQFKKLNEEIMKPDDLTAPLTLKPVTINENYAKDILKKSKDLSEAIVTMTNGVVNELYTKTKNLLDADNIQNISKKYNLECNVSLSDYEYYFRAKKLENSTITSQKECDLQKLPLTSDPIVDNVQTNRVKSTVHIPTNVYHAAQDIQEVARITKKLDEQYVKLKNDVNVQWQYFCSKTGFFKIYPGVQWYIQIAESKATPTMVDFFDCRSEQWYLESTSYSKKMMIIVDKSGSMKGRRRIIANHTVSEILNTLTENDFFNIILFNKTFLYAHNITNDKLVQGTAKNKKFMMEELARLFQPGGIAEYEVGIKESLRLLETDWKNSSYPTRFNYMLMIVSDGAPSNYKKEFDVFRNKSNSLPFRVFTYLIGQGITEEVPVKQMACENFGFAVQIATLADVKENVQKYLNVVARPISTQIPYSVWTGVQQNQILSKKPKSLLSLNKLASISVKSEIPLSISLNSTISNATAPVQSKKVEITKIPRIKMYVSSSKAVYSIIANASNSLFGSVGIDVPITDFLNTAPFWKLGVKGYLFGVTNNGFVIFHPRFRPQYESFMKYFYRNVDISEVELEVGTKLLKIPNEQVIKSKIRDKVIGFNKPTIENIGEYEVYDILDKFVTAFPIKRSYYLTTIKDTSYKFGLAIDFSFKIPSYESAPELTKADASNIDDPIEVPSSVKDFKGTMLTYYEYCKPGKKYLLESPLLLLKKIALGEVVCTKENDKLYSKSVMEELKNTKIYLTNWAKLKSTNQSRFDYVQQIFSMHHFGTTRYYNYQNLSYPNFLINHNQGLRDPLYVETIFNAESVSIKNPDLMTVKPLPNEEIKKDVSVEHIVFTSTLPLIKDGAYAGIVGVQVAQDKFFSFLKDQQPWNDTSIYNVYVVTSTGLVLYNNLNIKHTGEMLKDVDCSLMEVLVDQMSIFKTQELYDLQGLCPNQLVHTDSFANRLLDPFNQLFKFSLWLIYEFIILLQNFSFSSLVWSFSSAEENLAYSITNPFLSRYCWIKKTGFQFNKTSINTTIKYEPKCCKIGSNEVYVTGIENTNLLLVVLKKINPGCRCECKNTFAITSEIKRNWSEAIVNPKRDMPNYNSTFKIVQKLKPDGPCTDSALAISVSRSLLIISSILASIYILH